MCGVLPVLGPCSENMCGVPTSRYTLFLCSVPPQFDSVPWTTWLCLARWSQAQLVSLSVALLAEYFLSYTTGLTLAARPGWYQHQHTWYWLYWLPSQYYNTIYFSCFYWYFLYLVLNILSIPCTWYSLYLVLDTFHTLYCQDPNLASCQPMTAVGFWY